MCWKYNLTQLQVKHCVEYDYSTQLLVKNCVKKHIQCNLLKLMVFLYQFFRSLCRWPVATNCIENFTFRRNFWPIIVSIIYFWRNLWQLVIFLYQKFSDCEQLLKLMAFLYQIFSQFMQIRKLTNCVKNFDFLTQLLTYNCVDYLFST